MSELRFRLKPWQTQVLRLVGTALLITGIFWFIPFSQVIEALRGVKLGYIGASFALTLVVAYLESVQLWLLLRRIRIPMTVWLVFETKMITRFYGQFLPSELLASAIKLHRLAGPTKQWGEVMAALAMTRLVNMLALLLLGLVFWAIEMPTGPGRWIGFAMIGSIAILLAMHAVLVSPKVNQSFRQLLSMRGFAWLEGRLVGKVRLLAGTIVNSYRLFGKLVWSVTFLSILRHVLGIASFALAALSLDVRLSYLTIGWIRVVIQSLMMLPISFSGIGVREGSLVILLQQYSVPASQAVALAFLLFAIQLLSNSLGGLLELRNFVLPRAESAVSEE